jgi:predicted ABC-type ATPase
LPSIKKESLRLRVFAGPNGSGKSTIIKAVREYTMSGASIDFGIYVNADDIAVLLRDHKFSFSDYEISTTRNEFVSMAIDSGLIGEEFSEDEFLSSFKFQKNQKLSLIKKEADERIAQIISDFLRKKLLKENRKFSFETVFSHHGKLDIMRQAKDKGFKVYLYFVSTRSAEINIYRVQVRKEKGGHDVPAEKIKSRYERSLSLLYEAAQLAYQAFFFDNSLEKPNLFAHFKTGKKGKIWDKISEDDVPDWFRKYYSDKIPRRRT